MNPLKYQPMPKRLIQHSNVDYVILLISKIWNQFFFIFSHINGRSLWESCNSVGYLTSTSSRYPLILLVARSLIWSGSISTFEFASWKWLQHRPTIAIVGVEVLKVAGFFIGIVEISHIFIICRCISMDCLGNPSLNSSLEH